MRIFRGENLPRYHLRWLLVFVFAKDRFSAEIADQVKRYSQWYDVLEKEQTQKTHVPHVAYPGDGDNRPGGSNHHSAGCKKHDRRDETAYDTGSRAEIAYDDQNGAVVSRKERTKMAKKWLRWGPFAIPSAEGFHIVTACCPSTCTRRDSNTQPSDP